MQIEERFMPENKILFHKNYNFIVNLNGTNISFSRVSGLARGTSLQPYQEGGLNFKSHFLRGTSEGQTLTLEYGVTTDTAVLEQLIPGRYLEKGVYINVLSDDFGFSDCSYYLSGCYIKYIRFGELSASDSRLIINTIEITYDQMEYGT